MTCKSLFLPALLFCTIACTDDASRMRTTEAELDVPTKEGQWTYVSLETGSIVGTCAMSDTAAQNAYARRTDWDIAFTADGLVRTNSGTSGCGQGGIATTSLTYEDISLDDTPMDYLTDSDTVAVW